MFDRALEIGLTGFAVTDHEALSAHKQIMDYRDKLIGEGKIDDNFTVAFGNEAYLVDELGPNQTYYHWLVMAVDRKGHDILRKMSTQAWENSYSDRGMERVPVTKSQVEQIMLEEQGKGHVIVTSACLGGELGQCALDIKLEGEVPFGKPDEKLILERKQQMEDYVLWNQKVFGVDNFFIETAPNVKDDQRFANRMLKNVAKAYGANLIFATDSHYLKKEDQPIHRAFLNSKEGEREVDEFYSSAYMMDVSEVYEMMKLDFTEEEIDNMVENLERIRKRIIHYDLNHEQIIPKVEVNTDIEHSEVGEEYEYMNIMLNSEEEQDLYWIKTCLRELEVRGKWNEQYLETLENEARVLVKISERMKQSMASYYNTAQMLVDIMWTDGDSLVAPGRGSATAFLSNWLLDITQIDPIPYKLPFWRHLSEERPELPDIDLDSEGFKREQINMALKNYFGEDRVLNICTYGREKTKSAILTACRGLGVPSEVGSYLGGLVPNERGFDWGLSDVVNGNKDKGRKPVGEFVAEVRKYDKLLETAMKIEGLVSSRGSHAAGVYIFNDHFTSINAMMKAPNGMKVTQWDMKESDAMGGLKFDFLSIQGLDKIRAEMDLLIEDDLMEDKGSLRETYNHYLLPENLDYDPEIWEPAWTGEVLDLFQFQTAVGGEAIKKGKPHTVLEAAALNSLMRLMPMEDGTVPTDKFVYFKENIQRWYSELKKYNIPQEEIPILERHYLQSFGVPNTQEEMMLLLMDEEIAGFSVVDANVARKIVGKKQMEKIPWLRDKMFSEARCSQETIHYIWDTAIGVQMGYSFSLPHTVAYTIIALQELNLYNKFPSVYWNAACLIVNSGDEGDSTDYGKIAVAIGDITKHGTEVRVVDINESSLNFKPNGEGNYISYGLRPLSGVGEEFVQTIISNRPYTSLNDFLERCNPTKTQAVSLIKAGAFDIVNGDRVETMKEYTRYITDPRKKITMATMPKILEAGLFPQDKFPVEYQVYEFNRYLKNEVEKSEGAYVLDERSSGFFIEHFDSTNLELQGSKEVVSTKVWTRLYNKKIEPVKEWIKDNMDSLIEELRDYEAGDVYNTLASGSVPKWEMDSMSYYHTDHELSKVDFERYGIVNFDGLSREPEIAVHGRFPKYRTSSIIGTVIGKNKVKGSLDLLTPEGTVVLVKMYKGDFSYYDKQVSERKADGKKQIVEKSWFQRGNKVFIHGFRRDDQFLPKQYGGSPYPDVALITDYDDSGEISLKLERG